MKTSKYICKFLDSGNKGYVSVLDIVKGMLIVGVVSVTPYLVCCGLPVWKGVIIYPMSSVWGQSMLEFIGFVTSMVLIVLFVLFMVGLIGHLIDRSAEMKVFMCKRK